MDEGGIRQLEGCVIILGGGKTDQVGESAQVALADTSRPEFGGTAVAFLVRLVGVAGTGRFQGLH